MAIKNYTTKVDVHDTIAEIHKILAKAKAKKIMFDYGPKSRIDSICFAVETPEGDRTIRLPGNVKRVQMVLENQKKSSRTAIDASFEQAERVAWRIIKDWLDSQLAILETEMVDVGQVFLPYFADDKGKTVYDLYKSGALLQNLLSDPMTTDT